MKNDVEHGRALRVINWKGRYRLLWTDVDADGELVRVLKNEEIDLSFKTLDEMKALIVLVEEAKKAPVVCINGSNEKLYFCGEG